MRWFAVAVGIVAIAAVGVLGGQQVALSLAASEAPGHTFTISGAVTGLVPGRPATLRLTVTNTDAQAIQVRAVSATAQSAGPSCPGNLLDIAAYAGTPQTIVAGHGKAVVELPITLSAQAPNACRKVSFPLTYTARAEQWH
jgi:hypothetical protein